MKILEHLMKVVIVVSNSQNVANPHKVQGIKHLHLPCTDLVTEKASFDYTVSKQQIPSTVFPTVSALLFKEIDSAVTMKRHWDRLLGKCKQAFCS